MFLIVFLALSKFCVLDVTPSKQSICCFFRVQTLTAPDSWTLRDDELITIKHKRIRPAYMRARCINSASVLLQKHTVPVSPAAKNPSECDFVPSRYSIQSGYGSAISEKERPDAVQSASTSSGVTITSLSAPEQHAPQSLQEKSAAWIFSMSPSLPLIDICLRVHESKIESLPE